MSGRPRRRVLRWLVAATLLAVGVALLSTITRVEQSGWDRAEPRGQDGLRVHYVGSECETWASGRADETATEVRLTVWTVEVSTGCSDVGVARHVDVELDDPVGDRRVVDAAPGSP